MINEELEFLEIEDLPNDVREAIQEAERSYMNDSQSSNIPTGQPYRLNDADDFPFGTYIHNKTGRIISNHFRISDEYHIKQDKAFELVKELGFTQIFNRGFYGTNSHSSTLVFEKQIGNSLTLIMLGNFINKWVGKVTEKFKANWGIDIQIYSNDSSDEYQQLIDKMIGLGKKRKHEENNIALVIQTPRGYSTTSFELPKQKLDIELNYGTKFKPVHEKIITHLNQKKGKGLVLLHGTPGTGKTHYLKYLASKIKDKKVMFIPPFLADFITSPEMTPFLIENSNSVLFIEDAERVITDRQTGGANGVSNILNITDGILSDILNIQIVATFNMDKAKIDSALLRKGRLIAEHKFDALPIEDTNRLLKELGKQTVSNKPMTLTEIYNVEEEEFKSEDKYSPIGFNRY
jgi:SpoVK/Ycf46/Vps4 family AAA+-type ATPase